jgi:ABC-2 type transport system permease protein
VTTALRAEVRKLTTTQVWLWMIILAVGLTLLVTSLTAAFTDTDVDGQPIEGVLQAAVSFGYVIAAVLGVIGVTGEYRHLTVTPTFLSVPRRGTVIGAKLALYLLTGLIIGVLCVAAAALVGSVWMGARGIDVDLGSDAAVRIMVGGVITVAIFGIIGVGVGALIRNQVAAVVGLILYLFLIEGILSAIPKVQEAYPYLPGGAATALISSAETSDGIGVDLLEPWQGGLLLVVYGLAFAIIGSLLTVRRDVT